MDIRKQSLEKHYEWGGKVEVVSRVKIESRDDLSLAYTPGVAEACVRIHDDPSEVWRLTRRKNLVAVVTDTTLERIWLHYDPETDTFSFPSRGYYYHVSMPRKG